jgi:MFS family permease
MTISGGETRSYMSARAGWWMVAVFAIAAVVSYTDRFILGVLVDPIRHALSISDSQVSLLQGAAFAVIYVIAGLPMGRMADRGQRLKVLIAGAVLWCVGVIVCGFAPGFASLFAGRLLVGIGEAALAPAAASMIADAFPPKKRGLALGVFLMGFILGGPMAITVGGGLLQLGQAGGFQGLPVVGALEPWRAVLVIMGAGGLLAPLLFLTLREPPRHDSVGAAPLGEVVRHVAGAWPVLLPLYAGMALMSVGDYGVLSWVPSLLTRRFHMAPAELGVIFGIVTSLAGIGGSLLGGVVSDAAAKRGGPRARLLPVAAAAAAGAIAAAMVSGDVVLVFAGVALWTIASAVVGTSAIAALQDLVPNEYRGVGIAGVAFCNTLLGLGAGPTLVALATERVFGDPAAVGYSITLVVAPAGVLALVSFIACRRALHSRQTAISET